MSEVCETVRIKSAEAPGGYIVINKSDLQEGDELFDGVSMSESAPNDTTNPAQEGEGDA